MTKIVAEFIFVFSKFANKIDLKKEFFYMNQKKYQNLLLSLLIASFMGFNFNTIYAKETARYAAEAASGDSHEVESDLDNDFDSDENDKSFDQDSKGYFWPTVMYNKEGKSPEDVEKEEKEEKAKKYWVESYGKKIARHFALNDIYKINEDQLAEYLDEDKDAGENSLGVEFIDYMLGAVNEELLKLKESDKEEWKKYYGDKIAEYFFKQDYDKVTSEELQKYLEKYRGIKRFELDYMLKVVNSLLKNKEINHKVEILLNNFKNKNVYNISDFSQILDEAKLEFGEKSKFVQLLGTYKEKNQQKIIEWINEDLANIKSITCALDLSYAIEKENKRQGRRFEDRKRRENREKTHQVARALDLAYEINQIEQGNTVFVSSEEELKFSKEHIIRHPSKKMLTNSLDLAREVKNNEGMIAPQNSLADEDFDENDKENQKPSAVKAAAAAAGGDDFMEGSDYNSVLNQF